MKTAVIGAGVVGLTSAVRLREAGHDVTIITEAVTPNTTSDRAGAVFTPFSAAEEDEVIQTSFNVLSGLASSDPCSGVRLAPVREYATRSIETIPAWFIVTPDAQRISVATGSPFVDGYQATLPHMDMTRYLPWLLDQVRTLGIAIEIRHVAGPDEVLERGFDLVVNCTGLGARQFAHDDRVTAMRGQVLRVPNTTGLDHSLGAHDGPAITYVFAFPKYLVLGGTYEPDVWEAEPDEVVLADILVRCRALLRADGIAAADEIGETRLAAVAGLRPSRRIGDNHEAIRCEPESRPGGGMVIHNYGHGRAGVTLSWGYADKVVRLAEAIYAAR